MKLFAMLEKELRENIFKLVNNMNLCIKEFLERNNIDLDAIDRRIYTVKDINELLDKNRILGSRIEKDVCIKDILGLNSPFEEIVLSYPDFMDSFFDENGSSYHSRSLGLLKLDPGSKEFKESFNWNPFNLIGVDGKYFIAGDGNHRFSILRVLYLDRLRKCKTDKEREALDEEFTFHSEVCEIDPLKSYCKLLIGMYSDNLMDKTYFSGAYESNGRYFVARMFEDFNADYVEIPRDRYESVRNKILSVNEDSDEHYKSNDRTRITFADNRFLSLDDEQLISFTKEIVKNSTDEFVNDFLVCVYVNKFESFKKFIGDNFSDLFDLGGEKSASKERK